MFCPHSNESTFKVLNVSLRFVSLNIEVDLDLFIGLLIGVLFFVGCFYLFH